MATSTDNESNSLLELPVGLKARCQRMHGWSNELAVKALIGYRQFMELKVQLTDWNADTLSPSTLVDLVWHQHILDVCHYVKACNEYTNGNLIGHNPDGGSLDEDNRQERIKATKLALRARFSDKNIDNEIWSFENGILNGDETEKEAVSAKRRRITSNEANLPAEIPGTTVNCDEITIWVRDYTGGDTNGAAIYFKIKRCMKLERLFSTFASQMGRNLSDYRFLYEGDTLNGAQTADLIELEDGDEIVAMLGQTGC